MQDWYIKTMRVALCMFINLTSSIKPTGINPSGSNYPSGGINPTAINSLYVIVTGALLTV